MSTAFERDAYPGRPRILFVGLGESSHTHSWVDLLEGEPFNVRLFAMPQGSPPADWPVRTYVTEYYGDAANSATRRRLFPRASVARFARRNFERVFGAASVGELSAKWLASVVRDWRPHVVHTFGLAQAEFYFDARRRYGLEGAGKWVLQTRGGSDLALSHLDPERRGRIGEVLRACDQLLSDNLQNFRIARALGVRDEQL